VQPAASFCRLVFAACSWAYTSLSKGQTLNRSLLGNLMMVVLLVPAAGCVSPAEAHKTVFGSEAAAAVVRDATTVQAYRLASPSFFEQTLDKYEMAAGPVAVPAKQADQLKQLLLDPSSYDFSSAKSCLPDHGVRIEFVHNNRKVDVLLCFECRILSVYDGGQSVGGEDFDPINSQLVAIVKQLFPKDQAIQALK